MQSLESFLLELHDLGVTLTVQDGKLRSQGAKGALTPELQSRIREHRNAIVDFLSGLRGAQDSREPMPRADRSRPLPLSFAQQRLWFIDHFEGGSATYNIASAVRLSGRLDGGTLARALNEIVRRHEVLRTTFTAVDGTPFQVVAPSLTLDLPVKDLSEVPLGEQDSQLQWLALDEARTAFDLQAGPLIRARLIKLGQQEHLVLFTVHHIIADGWSMGVLVQELAAVYAAFRAGKPSPLPALGVQYADFASWQRGWLKEDVLATQMRYWKGRLVGAPTLLALPTDRPRPAVQRHAGANHLFTVPADLTAGLNALSGATQSTLFMTLAAAFNVLMARYSGQDDICIGTAIANRNRTDVEPLIGFFANTLVLRTRIEGNPPFTAVLDQMRTTALEAYSHQDMPFEQLIEALKIERDTSHSPLFQVSFALQNAPIGDLALPELKLQPVELGGTSAKFDLTLMMTERGDVLDATMEYDVDLFDRRTIERMAGHFDCLLRAVVADPRTPVLDLQIMGAEEGALVVQHSRAQSDAGAPAGTIHERFEAQAAKTPGHVAVTCGEQRLSYAELNTKANRLAHWLRGQGVGAESLVGLCLDRGLDLVVGLLAVLKAGGAYLPMDPSYPRDRLAYMLEDARPAVLLTQQSLLEVLPAPGAQGGTAPRVFCVDAQQAELEAFPAGNPASGALPANLAYVIYTSGSNGRPKGASIQHDNVLRLFSQTDAWFGFGEHDTWSLFHSYAFDFSVWEIWGALLHGGRLVVVPFEVSRSPALFHALLAREQVTILNQTPSAFQQLMEVDLRQCAAQPLALRQVIFGGEALNRAALEPWFAVHGHERPALVNMYGITETTVHVTYEKLGADPSAWARSVGRPIPDLGVFILDQRLNPVPAGVVGEMYVSGEGLARAYLRRPGLTAERFIPNPFPGAPGGRLYKSGDLARYLPDGRIEYVGRADNQVKLRGFRIEIGEIEAALAELPGIREVAVLAKEEAPGEKFLVAYVAAEQALSPVVGGQPRHLLPNGMAIVCQNAEVADFLYEEIFLDNSYLRHGVVLGEDACVFDVGAHVGMFSLFVGNGHPARSVYAFEPTPASFRMLELNAALFSKNIHPMNCGLSSRRQQVEFVYYPNAPLMSGRYADAADDSRLISSFLSNQIGLADDAVDAPVALHAERHLCELRTVSDVIDEHAVERIDLLKIDVEKSELDVLEGIRAEHWPRVRQVVVEVHDIEGRLRRISELLAGQGFECQVEQEKLLLGTALYNIYAVRPAAASPAARPAAERGADFYHAPWSTAALRQALLKRLPDYMVPARFCLLESLPLTANGKADRKALPALDAPQDAAVFVPPRTPVEEAVAGIWKSVLKLDRVGAEDNFFEIGGHSLRATVVLAHVNKAFKVELGIRALFESPTVAGLARQVELAQPPGCSLPAIERLPQQPGGYAISAAQRRLWLLHKLDPQNTAHHGMALLELPSTMPRETLERALGAVVERHEILRTVFVEGDDVLPLQVVQPPRPVALPEVRIESAQALQAHVRQFVAQPFDFERGPLFRVRMLHAWDGRRLLLSCMHEIVADGSSTAVLQREVMELLRAEVRGAKPQLAPLPIQYKDFAAWQNGLLRAESGDASRAYWHDQLGAEIPRLQLPFDAPPTLSTSNRGARYRFSVTGEVHRRLKALCLEHRVTSFMLLHASLCVLLSRLTGQRDVVLATPVAGRNAAELQTLIGFFLNTLLLRTQVEPDEPFDELLPRVRELTLQALQHQYYPFEKLIEELGLPRPTNQFPVTPVLFNVLNFREQGTPHRLPPAGHTTVDQDMKIELELTVQEHVDAIAFQCDYRAALFKPETIEYLMRQWQALLEQIARAAQTGVGCFSLFEPPEVLALQSPYLRFAGEPPAPPAQASVLSRLRRCTEATPEAVALEWQGQAWSYARLDAESNRVARHLQQLGLARGDVVALLVEQPMNHVAALVGVMKAAGVFMTLDASDPASRLESLVSAAPPAWWIADEAAAPALTGLTAAGESRRGIWLADAQAPAGFEHLAADELAPDADIRPEDPCYIFFTSGSTGMPKPILGQVKSLAHFIDWEIGAFSLDRGCRVSQLTAPTFDASLRDLFVPLCIGGTVCLPPARRLPPDELLEWLEQSRVTLVHCVPSVLRNLLAYLQLEPQASAGGLPALQRICLSGEVVLPTTVRAWQVRFGERIELVNFYGASETTMIRCHHRITAEDAARGFIPVGRPISHTDVIVLDPAGRPCAAGMPGEIYVRSPFFTLGYYRNPRMTAAVFVPNPLRPQSGEKVYRTGDMGLFLPDGSLRFLGRRDGQVKVNGVRVEIGEIENCLLDHPQIAEAAVIARTAEDGSNSLHAFVVATGALSTPLRDFMSGRLSVTLIPQSITELDTLPMTSSGKVDRKALAERQVPVSAPAAAHAVPASPTQRTLISLYEEVLERKGIGIHDDFFALGGHSLRALLLLSRIRKAFGVEVALRVLFESPTVAQLAAEVDRLCGARPAGGASMEKLLSEVRDELEALLRADGR
ncbi:MAG TPA: amino acid adenylation domain-containing protein [Aquabacterium sp.]|nr:amino acid adenylation domain-containing protein [Aquabacterium sp.]